MVRRFCSCCLLSFFFSDPVCDGVPVSPPWVCGPVLLLSRTMCAMGLDKNLLHVLFVVCRYFNLSALQRTLDSGTDSGCTRAVAACTVGCAIVAHVCWTSLGGPPSLRTCTMLLEGTIRRAKSALPSPTQRARRPWRFVARTSSMLCWMNACRFVCGSVSPSRVYCVVLSCVRDLTVVSCYRTSWGRGRRSSNLSASSAMSVWSSCCWIRGLRTVMASRIGSDGRSLCTR